LGELQRNEYRCRKRASLRGRDDLHSWRRHMSMHCKLNVHNNTNLLQPPRDPITPTILRAPTLHLEQTVYRIDCPSTSSRAPLRSSNPRVNSRSLSASPHFVMARLMLPLAALVALVPFASAGIQFTSPEAGATLKAGTSIQVGWEEGGDGPKLTDLTTFELFLCAGGSKEGTFVSASQIC
jgi:hypothetical protein